MAVHALKKTASSKCIEILRDALARAESGETIEVTIMEEGRDLNLRALWSGSDDLIKVSGHLARMQFIVQKRMSEEY